MTIRPFLAFLLILSACSSPAADPTTLPPLSTTTSATEVADSRIELLEAARASYSAPGAIAIVLDGDTLWSAAVGAADQSGTAATVDMRFRTASITKPIVAAIAMDMVGDGLIDLDQSVEIVLPGLLVHEPVTMRQLLSHTSGIFDMGNEGDPIAAIALIPDPAMVEEMTALLAAYQAGEQVLLSDRMTIALTETADRYFLPGTGYHYGNPNYQVVGMVIEATSGETLADALEERVAGPLALETFTLAPYDRRSPEFRGHEIGADGSLKDLTDDLFTLGNGGHGGVVTDAADLAAFFRALMAGDLLPAAVVAEMVAPTDASVAVEAPYGLGLAEYELDCGRFYGHGGAINGTLSLALVDASGERVVVVVFNARGPNEPNMVAVANDLVCGEG